MLPDPLHPAVVHFPIVLVVLLPLAALWAVWRLRHAPPGRRSWFLPMGVAIALALSAWAAVETGEAQEDRVERAVAERPFDAHEDAAERFLLFAGLTMLVMGLGLAPGRVGRAGRALGLMAAVGLLVAGVRVGHTGGMLAYQHGAAAAWTASAAPDGSAAPRGRGDRPHDID